VRSELGRRGGTQKSERKKREKRAKKVRRVGSDE
jgi:hypothetical protein